MEPKTSNKETMRAILKWSKKRNHNIVERILIWVLTIFMCNTLCSRANAQVVNVPYTGNGGPIDDAVLAGYEAELVGGTCNWTCYQDPKTVEWFARMAGVVGLLPPISGPQKLVLGATAWRAVHGYFERCQDRCVLNGCIQENVLRNTPKAPPPPEAEPVWQDAPPVGTYEVITLPDAPSIPDAGPLRPPPQYPQVDGVCKNPFVR